MKVETCCCYFLLINYILRNKVVLDYKIIYLYENLNYSTEYKDIQ